MNDYYALRVDVKPCSEDVTDYIAAVLGDLGYESFVPDETGLVAYVKSALYNEEQAHEALSDLPFDCEVSLKAEFIEGQDWNSEWEKNYFQPIVVGGDCVVHSSFHTDIPKAKYDIVIDPKMAFGTGHHPTTSLVIAQILQLDLAGATFIDMGTGTGILAILAAMRGAENVYGVEIDEFAYTNAIENVKLNSHPEISITNSDASAIASLPEADVLVANINLNVILADIKAYTGSLKPSGVMLLSGFYESDIPSIAKAAEDCGLEILGHTVMGDNWTCVKLVRR